MQPHPEPSFLNSIQKIFLINGLTSFTIFIILGYDTGIWVGTVKTRFVPNKKVHQVMTLTKISLIKLRKMLKMENGLKMDIKFIGKLQFLSLLLFFLYLVSLFSKTNRS